MHFPKAFKFANSIFRRVCIQKRKEKTKNRNSPF